MPDVIDPIRLEVLKNRFVSLAEEMGAALMRTSFSPNIKERRDFSCALFDRRGDMLAQAAHIPVHLGSMPLAVAAALERSDLGPGDMLLLNDPYRGGTHLPDVTLVAPVFLAGERPTFFLANRAHHADVGGMSAGSMPLSTEIFQEGLRIPPVRLVRQGEVDSELLALLLANVRTPVEREGDISAQIAANRTGERRLREIVGQYGLAEVERYGTALLDYGERLMAEVIAAIPDGSYSFADVLDDDGAGTAAIPIRCCLTVRGARATVDFTGCAPQVAGCLNAVRAITLSAVFYVFRLLAPEEIPNNAGCLRPVEVITRPGTVADCTFPAAVAGGNVETSQRLVDVLLGALAKALDETFGSFQEFRGKFGAVAANHFGSGWAWLVVMKKRLVLYSLPNQDSPLMVGESPLLGLDLWEHAYCAQYEWRQSEYIEAFWNVVNWEEVGRRYEAALEERPPRRPYVT